MATYSVTPRPAFLEWCQVHAPVFVEQAAEIGLGAGQAGEFNAAAELAAAALLEQEQARQAALVATQRVEQAFAALAARAGDAVRSIRAFAGTAADANRVYALAQVPPPAAPSPVPPPGRPNRLTVALDATTGSLTLRWKANHPASARGTSYIIRRRILDETGRTREGIPEGVGARRDSRTSSSRTSEFTFIGVSGKKTFTDETLPAGIDSVQYTVQGQRSNLSGPVSPIFTVNFGKRADGARVVQGVTTWTATPAMWNVEIPAPSANGRAPALHR